ncbi:hypothetical protein L596_028852 [Steinernema carpocapsae]|uniref:RNA helicase n=1 Tax=Steinernema carpocapsae TaxID=34508 RepID=A0A4U5LZL1_STECR|nr:hypothetical protein L596_028852 [Steinernema carpocapsae]
MRPIPGGGRFGSDDDGFGGGSRGGRGGGRFGDDHGFGGDSFRGGHGGFGGGRGFDDADDNRFASQRASGGFRGGRGGFGGVEGSDGGFEGRGGRGGGGRGGFGGPRFGGDEDDNGFGPPIGGRGGFGGSRGGGSGFDNGDSFGGGRGGGRGSFGGGFDGGMDGGRGGGFGARNFSAEGYGSAALEDGDRPPPATYIPSVKNVDDLFQEDANSAVYAEEVEDADCLVTGIPPEDVECWDKWEDCNLPESLRDNVVNRCKYKKPRKIQMKVMPLVTKGYDVMGHAETGGGKTAAFLLPIMQKIIETPPEDQTSRCSPVALIIGPTRELVLQLSDQARKFADKTCVTVAKAYGQYNVRENIREIRSGCNILCATPGRLKHFARNGEIRWNNLRYLVLDEADHLIESNFWEDIIDIIQCEGFPKKENRQTLLFSATFAEDINNLVNMILRESHKVMVSNKDISGSACSKVRQTFMTVSKCDKNNKIFEILEKELEEIKKDAEDPSKAHVRRTLIFVEQKRTTDLVAAYLSSKEIKATSINGDRSQELREKAINDFRKEMVHVLVATDVCARGIDIHDLEHVINYDMPKDSKTYIHRIGRTGRLCEGTATTFIDPDEDGCDLCSEIKTIVEKANQQPPDFLVDVAEGRRPEGFRQDSYGGHDDVSNGYGAQENGVDGGEPITDPNEDTEDW